MHESHIIEAREILFVELVHVLMIIFVVDIRLLRLDDGETDSIYG